MNRPPEYVELAPVDGRRTRRWRLAGLARATGGARRLPARPGAHHGAQPVSVDLERPGDLHDVLVAHELVRVGSDDRGCGFAGARSTLERAKVRRREEAVQPELQEGCCPLDRSRECCRVLLPEVAGVTAGREI